MTESWFIPTLAAMALYGLFNFLYKIAAEKKCDSIAVVNIATATVFCLSLVANAARGFSFENMRLTLLLTLGNGCFFLLGSVLKVEALRYVPSSIAFPLNKMNVLFVLFIAVLVFGEKPGLVQFLGIAVACLMIFTARKKPRGQDAAGRYTRGFVLALLAGLFTAISVSFGRVAARSPVGRLNYVMLSYGLVALLAYTWNRGVRKGRYSVDRVTVAIGVSAGCLNFIGYLLVLEAFSKGPLSIIHPVLSMAIIIPIVLSVIFFREKLTPRNVVAVVLCLIAVFLLRWN